MATSGSTANHDERARKLTSLKDVLARMLPAVAPAETREVEITAGIHRVLAQDVIPIESWPQAQLATRDGWAVKAEWTADATSYSPALLPGGVEQVELGSRLPRGTDAVAPLDTIQFDLAGAHALMTLAPGDGILPPAADATLGKVFLGAGRLLRHADIVMLASIGIEKVEVAVPRVRIASLAKYAHIHLLATFIGESVAVQGGWVLPIESDDKPDFEGLFSEGADLIVLVGAGGSREPDDSIAALARGGRLEAHGIAITPGETSAVGFIGPIPVLILPGRIDAALAGWTLIGEPILNKLSGRTDQPAAISATLQRKVTSNLGLTEMIPVRLNQAGALPLASGYVPLQVLAQADGYIFVPAESEGFPEGTTVAVRLLP